MSAVAEPAPTNAAALATITRLLHGETVTYRTSRVRWRNAVRTAVSFAVVLGGVMVVVSLFSPDPSVASMIPFVGLMVLIGTFFGGLLAAVSIYSIELSSEGVRVPGVPGDFVVWAEVVGLKGPDIVFSKAGKLRRVYLYSDVPIDKTWPQARECLAVVSFFVDRARHGSAADSIDAR